MIETGICPISRGEVSYQKVSYGMSEKGPMEKGQRWYRVLGLLHSDTLVLCSSKAIQKEPTQMAARFGWSSPDPRFGSVIELHSNHLHGPFDLTSIGKTLARQGIATEESPPALLEIEPTRPFGDEDVLEPWMLC